MANIVVSALATWNGKALKKGKQDISVFDKQLKGLARTLGVTFSAATLIAFSKKAVKAFSEDQAAAKSLQLQLENTGNAFRVTEVEAYIKGLEKTFAILTDLRAPFQTFLNLTGSVGLAQRSLESALNISAGTGQSLGTVVSAISAGIRGQTKAIKGLNTGIDESIIETGDMNLIMSALEKRFSGQAAARLDTYAGKMDVLKKGVDEATKSIGTGLVDALIILSKDESISGLATDFENLGNNIAFAIVEMAKLLKRFNDLVDNPSFKAGLLALAILSKKPSAVLGAFGIIGSDAAGSALTSRRTTAQKNIGGFSGIPDLRTSKELVKARKEEYKIITGKNALENKNVEELKKKFDLERIGITAALNSATDEETKLRLKAQLAILDNNEAMAKKLLAEIELADAAKKLAEIFRTLLPSRMAELADVIDKTNRKIAANIASNEAELAELRAKINTKIFGAEIAALIPAVPSPAAAAPLVERFKDLLPERQMALDELIAKTQRKIVGTDYGYTGGNSGNMSSAVALQVTIDTTNTSDRFTQLIAESIQVAQRNGFSTSAAGSLAV